MGASAGPCTAGEDGWIFACKGNAYAAIWSSSPGRWTTSGVWEDVDLRFEHPRVALYIEVGDATTHASFAKLCQEARGAEPAFDDGRLVLISISTKDSETLALRFEDGPKRNGRTVPTRYGRLDSPWGNLPLGTPAMTLGHAGA